MSDSTPDAAGAPTQDEPAADNSALISQEINLDEEEDQPRARRRRRAHPPRVNGTDVARVEFKYVVIDNDAERAEAKLNRLLVEGWQLRPISFNSPGPYLMAVRLFTKDNHLIQPDLSQLVMEGGFLGDY